MVENEMMENERRAWKIVLWVVALAVALGVAVFALIRAEKRIRRLCYRLEQRLGLKKNAEFRLDFEEV